MTDGLTEGRHELAGKREGLAAPADGKTTAIVAPPPAPQAGPEASEIAAPARVVLLGSGEAGRPLAIALRRLGAEVIDVAADRGAPAIRELKPDFVVKLAGAVSIGALGVLDGLAESSDPDEVIELVPSARSARITADREGLRRLAADQLGLPTAPFWFVGSVGELRAVAAHAGYPLLVKPVAGVAGRGQSVVARPEELEAAWERASGPGSAPRRVLAETVVEVEFFVTLLAVRSEGPRGPVIEFCAPIGHRDANGEVVESWQPQPMRPAALDAAKSIAARIVKALGGRGVFGVELMIKGDEVYFSDVTPSPGDSAWVTACSQRLSAFDLQARAILGLPVDTVMVSPGAARVVGAGRAAPSAEALATALGVAESNVEVFGPSGRSPGIGVALATAPDLAIARDRARQVAAALDVRDSGG